jgi:hypothetical protein
LLSTSCQQTENVNMTTCCRGYLIDDDLTILEESHDSGVP